MAEYEFIEEELQYEEEELSSESGSEYGYASDVIEEIVSHMSSEDQRRVPKTETLSMPVN